MNDRWEKLRFFRDFEGLGRHVNGGVPQAFRDAGLELCLAPEFYARGEDLDFT